MSGPTPTPVPWRRWAVGTVAASAVVVVGAALATAAGAVVHGHPLYAVLLGATFVVAVVVLLRTVRAARAGRPPTVRRGWRRGAWVGALVAAVVWTAVIGWLRPFPATAPALEALSSDAAVTVTETATTLVLAPTGVPAGTTGTGLVLQPGAKVEARAYAAVLRPLAAVGHVVVVPKQPLAIGFLAVGALDDARGAHPDVDRWVAGGHSLGGTVAALEADAAGDEGGRAPVVGLLLWASYPADDVSGSLGTAVLSVSASEDGLATPDDIAASAADLPADATFVVVEGAVHAFFGDYGPQPGDGEATVDRDAARAEITAASAAFLAGLGG